MQSIFSKLFGIYYLIVKELLIFSFFKGVLVVITLKDINKKFKI